MWDTPAGGTSAKQKTPEPQAVKELFDASPRPFLSIIGEHLRDGSVVVQGKQIGYLSGI